MKKRILSLVLSLTMDDDHLYFISSGSYVASDSDVYSSHKWTQLDECWNNRVTYMVLSLTAETNATTESIVRTHGTLVQDENDTTLFIMVDAQGNEMDLLNAAV